MHDYVITNTEIWDCKPEKSLYAMLNMKRGEDLYPCLPYTPTRECQNRTELEQFFLVVPKYTQIIDDERQTVLKKM